MTALDDELRHVIRDAMSDSIDEKGTIHFDVASENILAAIRKVVQLKRLPPPAEAEVFTRLLASLAVDDPYTLISPIERSQFPLSEPMVTQNWAVLGRITDEINENVRTYGRTV